MDHNLPITECLYTASCPIDKLDTLLGIELMVFEQEKAAIQVKKVVKSIEKAVIEIYNHLTKYKSGRIIYVGAGTSGRIGVQDSVELFPTFNWPKNRVDFIMAGGKNAVFKAIENAEDDVDIATAAVEKKLINNQDAVIGLAASGNTPFTCEVLEQSRNKGALTIAISNNPLGRILKSGKIKIILDTKQEVIAGSTRLKAATAQKICLNIISSMVMVKMGRVKNGQMSNMVPTNNKLRKRKNFIDSHI